MYASMCVGSANISYVYASTTKWCDAVARVRTIHTRTQKVA